jgi:hypothetical protein
MVMGRKYKELLRVVREGWRGLHFRGCEFVLI